jgi:hypothetical protein
VIHFDTIAILKLYCMFLSSLHFIITYVTHIITSVLDLVNSSSLCLLNDSEPSLSLCPLNEFEPSLKIPNENEVLRLHPPTHELLVEKYISSYAKRVKHECMCTYSYIYIYIYTCKYHPLTFSSTIFF